MAGFQARELLQRVHFLRTLDREALQEIEENLQWIHYPAGTSILTPGSSVESLSFIAQGEVEYLDRNPDEAECRHVTLVPGDIFGETELLFDQPCYTTVRTTTATSILHWNRRHLVEFLKSHPSALSSLRLAAESHLLARSVHFPWLGSQEVIYALARKHPAKFLQRLTLPLLLFTGAILLAWWQPLGLGSDSIWIGLGVALAALLIGVWQWLDWRNDFYMVTDRRVVWLEKVIGLYDSRREAPLHMVLSVSVSTQVMGRLLGYGDVVIRTYTGKIVFRDVGQPIAIAAMVEEHWRRKMDQQQHSDRETLVDAIHQRFGDQPIEETEEPAHETPPEAEFLHTPSNVGLDRWTFQVRFEEGGVITYRKHWAVLLRRISIPSLLIVLVASIFGAHLGGLLQLMRTSTIGVATVIALVPLLLWWGYEYADWANDIYQISPTQILDINKKPLAREVRKVAPLENILGTEVDRKGLVGLLLNYGDVITNVGTTQFVFEGVFDPTGVQQDIVSAQDAFLTRKGDQERRQRQDEVLEWIQVYHDEIASRRLGGRSKEEGRNGYP